MDLFGFSMGGMIAQEIVPMEPQLVRKMIIAGTGPAGGEGISKVARVTYLDMVRGLSHRLIWRITRLVISAVKNCSEFSMVLSQSIPVSAHRLDQSPIIFPTALVWVSQIVRSAQ